MSSVDLIKERVNIADIVGGYVKLERSGANFRARCPFHTERTPSFFVSPSRGTFHCFGCNKGGDIFTFVQDIEGLDFPGALRLLAERAGVELPRFSKKEATEEESLRTILEAATIFFQRNLAGSKEPIAYVYGRGLTKQSLQDFRIGFAPPGFENLTEYLREKGFSMEQAEHAGLLIRGARGYHDRFRSRIMFPLYDSVGRVVGFSGRIFGEDDGMGKYVNTPETPLYHKSRILYGYDRAKSVIREKGSAVLVEGQMDLIAAHQSGVKNAVAVSGTAFSEHHAAMLSRLASKVVLAFDADSAGQKASARAAGILFAKGVDVLSAEIPEGQDPADMLKGDSGALEKIVLRAEPFITHMLRALKRDHADIREFRRTASDAIVPLLARMEHKIDQAHFVGEVATALSIPEESIWEAIVRAQKDIALSLPKEAEPRAEPRAPSRADMLTRHIESVLLWQENMKEPAIDVASRRKELADLTGRAISDADREERAFEAEMYFGGKDVGREIMTLFSELKAEYLKDRLRKTTDLLREAESSGDAKKTEDLIAECRDISKEMASLHLKA